MYKPARVRHDYNNGSFGHISSHVDQKGVLHASFIGTDGLHERVKVGQEGVERHAGEWYAHSVDEMPVKSLKVLHVGNPNFIQAIYQAKGMQPPTEPHHTKIPEHLALEADEHSFRKELQERLALI